MQRRQGIDRADGREFPVISNSSVVIALARVCCLDLLEKLFSRVIVPEAVWQEVTIWVSSSLVVGHLVLGNAFKGEINCILDLCTKRLGEAGVYFGEVLAVGL